MITKDEAVKLRHGQTLYHQTHRNADGTPQRWRINGRVKTWKTRPEEFEVPLKHGMYSYWYLTNANASEFYLDEAHAMGELDDEEKLARWEGR